MALRDDLLPVIDAIRNIPGAFGLRRYQVWCRKRVWTGTRVGQGTVTVTDTRILVGGQDPKVREVANEDIIAGGQDDKLFEIGPITPEFAGGGVAPDTVDPAQTSAITEIVYLVKGPGIPANGAECQKIKSAFDRSFRYTVTVRMKGRTL